MALSRKLLKGMGLTEEQIDSVIDAHTETVDGLKEQIKTLKADADKLEGVQKELNDLKNGEDYKAKFDAEHKAFEDFKKDIASKESLAAKKTQYLKMLVDGLKINKDDADLIVAGTDFETFALDKDGKLADVDGLTNTAKERYKRYIPSVETKGADVDNPAKGDSGNGANPRAAELAKMFHERRYGVAPAKEGANKTE